MEFLTPVFATIISLRPPQHKTSRGRGLPGLGIGRGRGRPRTGNFEFSRGARERGGGPGREFPKT